MNAVPFGVLEWKFLYFHKLNRFSWNLAFSRDFLLDIKRDTFDGKYQFFQSKAIPFSAYFNEIKEITDFSEITDSKEIKDISDFNQFSKESLIPFGVLTWKIVYFHINWTDFSPNHDISNRPAWKESIIVYLPSFLENSYQTWKLLGPHSKYYVFTQLSGTQQPWILCIKYSGNPVNRGKFRLEQLEQNFPCRNHMKLIKESVEHSPLVPTV